MKKKLLTILLVASMTCGAVLLSFANLTAFAENALDETEPTANTAEGVAETNQNSDLIEVSWLFSGNEKIEREIVHEGKCGDSVTWKFYDDGELVISGTGKMKDYEWHTTYCRAPWCYEYDIGGIITKITVEPGVTSIGNAAFSSCDNLTSIMIPDGVKFIGNEAFLSCSRLTGITIPNGVTRIGDDAFFDCSRLTSVAIPDSVTFIGNRAFFYCNSLTEIMIPRRVTFIGDEAFYNCSSLTNITIPDGVTSIGDQAFYNCSSLTDITIPKSVININSNAFGGCKKLNFRVYAGTYGERYAKQYFPTNYSIISENLGKVTDVILDKSEVTLTVNEKTLLTARVIPDDATNKNLTWNTSNASVVTVKNGVVTAVAPGTATVTVTTDDGGKTAVCTVTVNAATVSVTGVTLNKTSASLTVGENQILIATVSPADATDQSVSWKSSDTSIATVENGVVTAVAPGTATITVTTADGGKTASCVVTVSEPIAEDKPTVRVSSVTGRAGETVDITVELENNPGIAVIGFDVNYDTNALALKAFTAGNIFADTEVDGNLEKVPFTFNAYTGKANKTDSGILITLQFEIKEDCEEKTYPIGVTAVEALNIDEEDVLFAVSSGAVTVRNVIPGDVNGDGTVARSDLLRLAKYFAGHSVEIDQAAADVTGDGKLARADLLRLAKYFAGHSVVLGK